MEDTKLPLTEHLTELRKRILISVVVLFFAFLFFFNYSEELFKLITFPLNSEIKLDLANPYIRIEEKVGPPLVFLAVAEAFWIHFKVSFVAAFIASLPIIFYQLWSFIAPGLLEKEKRYVMPFVLFATLLFLVGSLFCFYVVLPFSLTFLLGYKTASLTPMLSVEKYIDFCLKFILAFGLIFELPVVILYLTRFGIVSPKTLAKHRKYAVLFSFIAAAILTPTPDAFNQVLMAIPIILLYEIGMLLSIIIYRKRKVPDERGKVHKTI
ncbi:MAG: twin-arginine translocase subunit TatC [Nitrospiraceae bacterium]|nr:twin-arginine translocase subunit TatC [Nitrospiraceae bacterium]